MRNKEEAKTEFINMVINSWTYNKMTTEEKEKCLTIFDDDVKGNFNQRYHIYHMIYHSFLIGIGYTDWTWRTDEKTFLILE